MSWTVNISIFIYSFARQFNWSSGSASVLPYFFLLLLSFYTFFHQLWTEIIHHSTSRNSFLWCCTFFSACESKAIPINRKHCELCISECFFIFISDAFHETDFNTIRTCICVTTMHTKHTLLAFNFRKNASNHRITSLIFYLFPSYKIISTRYKESEIELVKLLSWNLGNHIFAQQCTRIQCTPNRKFLSKSPFHSFARCFLSFFSIASLLSATVSFSRSHSLIQS